MRACLFSFWGEEARHTHSLASHCALSHATSPLCDGASDAARMCVSCLSATSLPVVVGAQLHTLLLDKWRPMLFRPRFSVSLDKQHAMLFRWQCQLWLLFLTQLFAALKFPCDST